MLGASEYRGLQCFLGGDIPRTPLTKPSAHRDLLSTFVLPELA